MPRSAIVQMQYVSQLDFHQVQYKLQFSTDYGLQFGGLGCSIKLEGFDCFQVLFTDPGLLCTFRFRV